jgi:glycosyltransferase involved in cell wall biosynthesis
MTGPVTVVMPARDAARFVVEAVQSVLAAPEVGELIVVDDGSRDDTARRVRALAGADARVRLHETPARGVAAARNHGMRLASSPFVTFFDADDVLVAGSFAARIAACADGAGAGAALGRLHGVIDASGRPLDISLMARVRACDATNRALGRVTFDRLCQGACFYGYTALLYRRDLLAAVGGFDESLPAAEDYDLALRVARRGPIAFVDVPVLLYRLHDHNLTVAFDPQRGFFGRPHVRAAHARVQQAAARELAPPAEALPCP